MKTRISDQQALEQLENLDMDKAEVSDSAATADIRAAVKMKGTMQDMIDQAVHDAREAGVTWLEIGLALGISPQGARQRYGLEAPKR